MRFTSILLSVASLSAFAAAVPYGADAGMDLDARSAFADVDPYLFARSAFPEADYAELIARAKGAKEKNVNIALAKESKNFSPKDKQNAKGDACTALDKAGCTHGDITHAWHTSNGESEEHMSIKPTAGDNAGRGTIHMYRNGKVTQGTGGKYSYKRDLAALEMQRRTMLEERDAFAEAYEIFADLYL